MIADTSGLRVVPLQRCGDEMVALHVMQATAEATGQPLPTAWGRLAAALETARQCYRLMRARSLCMRARAGAVCVRRRGARCAECYSIQEETRNV